VLSITILVSATDGKKKQKKKKQRVKQSHYRPWQALKVAGGWGSQISRLSTHECGKIVSPTHRLPLPPRKYFWHSFLLEAPRPKGLCQWKIPMPPSENEPETFRLVACLSQLMTALFNILRPDINSSNATIIFTDYLLRFHKLLLYCTSTDL
jgi:hypothetical protein